MGGPTLRRRRLARELGRLREATGLTIEQAASAAGISPSHLSRVERAQVGVRVPVVTMLLTTYNADTATTTYLTEIAREGAQRGWWHPYVGTIPEQYVTYIGFEADAEQIWSFDASTVPGLLQTPDYARAMLRSAATAFTDEEITRRVDIRVQRQATLTSDQPPQVWAVIDEAVLHRQVGGAATLAAQLRHITDVAALHHVEVQVLPFAVGAHPGTPGSFIVLRFPDPSDPPVMYIETMAGDLYPESQDHINGAILAFDRLRALALNPDDSIALIHTAAKELT